MEDQTEEILRQNSPAFSFVSLMHKNARSRPTIDFMHFMQDSLELAIKSGMEFEPKDFERMMYISGLWWMGGSRETFYAIACESDNTSACRSYESLVGREPFTLLDSKRIYVGLHFLWGDKTLTDVVQCTSFAEDNSYLVGCSYKDMDLSKYGHCKIKPDGRILSSERDDPFIEHGNNKILRRYKITHDDLREHRKKLKALKQV